MKKLTILLAVLLIGISIWFEVDHTSLNQKLSNKTEALIQMQSQSFRQAQSLMILQTCASTAEGIHNDTGRYYSVIDCANKTSK